MHAHDTFLQAGGSGFLMFEPRRPLVCATVRWSWSLRQELPPAAFNPLFFSDTEMADVYRISFLIRGLTSSNRFSSKDGTGSGDRLRSECGCKPAAFVL